ncbi:MAG: signal peptidase II [Chloroflexi bacterium]|nr:signal peptidase II [Chloroflexota bacterium]
MQKENNPSDGWRRNISFFLVMLLVVAADQLSKLWIQFTLAVGQSIPETGYPRITHIRNTGAAFGLFQNQTYALTVVSILGAIVVLVFAMRYYRRPPFSDGTMGRIALSLILGGTIGNLIDRIRLRYVTDFIDWGWWPAFNLADSAVVIGTILFALSLISLAKSEQD